MAVLSLVVSEKVPHSSTHVPLLGIFKQASLCHLYRAGKRFFFSNLKLIGFWVCRDIAELFEYSNQKEFFIFQFEHLRSLHYEHITYS